MSAAAAAADVGLVTCTAQVKHADSYHCLLTLLLKPCFWLRGICRCPYNSISKGGNQKGETGKPKHQAVDTAYHTLATQCQLDPWKALSLPVYT